MYGQRLRIVLPFGTEARVSVPLLAGCDAVAAALRVDGVAVVYDATEEHWTVAAVGPGERTVELACGDHCRPAVA